MAFGVSIAVLISINGPVIYIQHKSLNNEVLRYCGERRQFNRLALDLRAKWINIVVSAFGNGKPLGITEDVNNYNFIWNQRISFWWWLH